MATDDLYVQRGRRGNEPDLLLVSRQRGRRWISRPIPQAHGGLADDVVALDHDRNGLVDFFVTNGRQSDRVDPAHRRVPPRTA